MSIVLNETAWAEDMIRANNLGKSPVETLRRVARYYLDTGLTKKQTRDKLDIYLKRCDPKISLPMWAATLDRIAMQATKREPVNIDEIFITDKEMKIVDGIKKKQTKRLAFALLCLAKYNLAVDPNGDGWVTYRDSEIMKLANINTSLKRQALMYGELEELGLVKFPKRVDSVSMQVCFVTDGEPVMRISNFVNLGYQYMMHHGDPFFECENCGVVTRYNKGGNPARQKYCSECATKVKLKQSVESVMRQRRQNKSV